MLACVVVEEESVVEASVVVVVPPAGAVSVLDGTVELVPVVEVTVEVEGSVLAGGLLAVVVESVVVGGNAEVDVALEDVKSLGAVELLPLASLELDRLVGPVDAAGTDVAPALPADVGSELGAAGGETLLVLAATGTTGVAGVAWRWIATGETVRTGWAAWLAPMTPVAIATTLISFATTPPDPTTPPATT